MKTVLLVLLVVASVYAEPYMADLVDVPVDKLIANLEKKAAKAPKDYNVRYPLARVHMMAYALASQTMKADRTSGQPWFGMFEEASYLPRTVSADASRRTQHLRRAVEEYRAALAIRPDSQAARLGLAWVLQQSGKKAEASKLYREVLEQSYQEHAVRNEPAFGVTLGEEAGRYLIGLLQDPAETARVREKIKKLAALPRAVTPVLIPLAEAPFETLVDPEAGVLFDLDGSGLERRWGWITPRAAWLVYLDRRDRVESGLQMLGSSAFWIVWDNGYAALSALDEDLDGWLRGWELEHLALWNDRDRDGRSLPDELLGLDTLGIVGLSCSFQVHPGGFPFNPRGVRYSDGRIGPSYDWTPSTR